MDRLDRIGKIGHHRKIGLDRIFEQMLDRCSPTVRYYKNQATQARVVIYI
jgi:hypothetical protein